MNSDGQVYADFFGDAPQQDIERLAEARCAELDAEIRKVLQGKERAVQSLIDQHEPRA